ncbi:MAG: SUMF1/EgtB/PvdO family nonheme iron enzyme, partial [Planctomycetaceae bacterium]|nr:SUMF1/EgtB/PvdO family nonheme iron enzyme [Planctomycetaceae bacterium]
MPNSLPESIDIELAPGCVMTFCLLRAGEFQMGSRGGFARVEPVHRVHITHPFYLGATPVTQLQWRSLVEISPAPDVGEALNPSPS